MKREALERIYDKLLTIQVEYYTEDPNEPMMFGDDDDAYKDKKHINYLCDEWLPTNIKIFFPERNSYGEFKTNKFKPSWNRRIELGLEGYMEKNKYHEPEINREYLEKRQAFVKWAENELIKFGNNKARAVYVPANTASPETIQWLTAKEALKIFPEYEDLTIKNLNSKVERGAVVDEEDLFKKPYAYNRGKEIIEYCGSTIYHIYNNQKECCDCIRVKRTTLSMAIKKGTPLLGYHYFKYKEN